MPREMVRHLEGQIMTITPIKQSSVETAFQSNAAQNVTVRRRGPKEWYFTFEANDPLTGALETYAQLTKRGELKTWSDPRLLFEYLLEHHQVQSGSFIIEDVVDETLPGIRQK